MQAIQPTPKFLFDRDFDDLDILREIVQQEVEELEQAQEAIEPAAPAAPTFSEEDMAAARKQAFEKGKRDGIAETLASIEQRVAISLDKIAGEVENVFASQTSNNEALTRDAAHLALSVAKKLFPRLHETYGLGEIVGVTEDILSHLIREPRLVVSVHDAHVDALRTRLSDFLAKRGFSGNLELRGDNALAGGDCKIEWMGGDAARDTSALFAEIEATIERHVGKMAMDETSDRASGRPLQD